MLPLAPLAGGVGAAQEEVGHALIEHGMANGTRIHVPNSKMKCDRDNPTGHGVIFIGNQGQVYCYIAPGGV
jgi:hypothetical protein